MPADPLAAAIENHLPLVVLSAHLDDAVLSCGALIAHAASRTPVTVATLFTEAGPPPHTLSARRYLRQVRARDASTLYRQRRDEDRAALEPMAVTCVHAGLTEAQFRLRTRPGPRDHQWWAGLLPELAHMYPVYRLHVASGRIAPGDFGTLRQASEFIQRIARPGPSLVLAPLGVGRHVDHVLVRTAAELSGVGVAYYSDFPYNQRHAADSGFIRRNGLVESRWSQLLEAKAGLIRTYQTQANAIFPDGVIPAVPEVFFCAPVSGGFPDGAQ